MGKKKQSIGVSEMEDMVQSEGGTLYELVPAELENGAMEEDARRKVAKDNVAELLGDQFEPDIIDEVREFRCGRRSRTRSAAGLVRRADVATDASNIWDVRQEVEAEGAMHTPKSGCYETAGHTRAGMQSPQRRSGTSASGPRDHPFCAARAATHLAPSAARPPGRPLTSLWTQ
jgi:hypothetical protein